MQLSQAYTPSPFSSPAYLPLQCIGMLGFNHSLGQIKTSVLVTYVQIDKLSTIDYQLSRQYKMVKLGLGKRQGYGEFCSPNWFLGAVGVQLEEYAFKYNYEYLSNK
ncbi:hypothetical protein N9595_00685 [Bacteroidia bacterium]|nr:hypothetical protein [Bacteroidia bacterium]